LERPKNLVHSYGQLFARTKAVGCLWECRQDLSRTSSNDNESFAWLGVFVLSEVANPPPHAVTGSRERIDEASEKVAVVLVYDVRCLLKRHDAWLAS
jgi:hypothetical protein